MIDKDLIKFRETDGYWKFIAELPDGKTITTNREGSGLWVHNQKGDYHQTAGTGQFHAKSLAHFKRQIRWFYTPPF